MKTQDLQNLPAYYPSDAPWDAPRSVSDDVGGIYLLAAEYERYGARMALCGGLLRFGGSTLTETGETRLSLREAHFCRGRHCPGCQWRRSLMGQPRFYQSLPPIVAEYPEARGLFLTLTVRNTPIWSRGDMLNRMTAAFPRMKVRK